MRVDELMLSLDRSLVSPEATLQEAYLRLLDHQLTCLVLDEWPRGRIVRMRAILERLAGAVLHGQVPDPERSVATISEPVETVPWDLPVELAAKILWRRPSRALLVSDRRGAAVGLVGWPQLNRFFDEMLDLDRAARLEVRLEDHPGALGRVFASVGGIGANIQAAFLSHAHGGQRRVAFYVDGASEAAVRAALRAAGLDLLP